MRNQKIIIYQQVFDLQVNITKNNQIKWISICQYKN